jgi:hypothetical protein
MVPYYPPGFPLHLAAAGTFGNWAWAPFFVSPIAALLLVITTYFLGRELSLSRALAFLCAAILGGSSILLFQGVQPMSDAVAGLWAAAAMLFGLKARSHSRYAAASGLAFGLAVLVRPANVVLIVPIAFALPWSLPAALLFVSGGLPCAAFLMAWNSALYGGAFETGYAGVLSGGGFGWRFFPERFPHYLGNVSLLLSPLIPLGWLAAPADRRIPGRDRALLMTWFGGYLLLYSFWGPDHAWWYTRYLIPALPGLVIAAVLAARDLLRRIAERTPRLAAWVAVTFLVVVAAAETWGYQTWGPLRVANGQRVFPEACELTARKAGGPAVVVSMDFSGALAYYTRTTPVRWDCLQPGDFAVVVEHARRKGFGVFALLLDQEAKEAVVHAPGAWTFVGRIQHATLWRLEP